MANRRNPCSMNPRLPELGEQLGICICGVNNADDSSARFREPIFGR